MMTQVKEDASNLSLRVGRDELLYYIDALLRSLLSSLLLNIQYVRLNNLINNTFEQLNE